MEKLNRTVAFTYFADQDVYQIESWKHEPVCECTVKEVWSDMRQALMNYFKLLGEIQAMKEYQQQKPISKLDEVLQNSEKNKESELNVSDYTDEVTIVQEAQGLNLRMYRKVILSNPKDGETPNDLDLRVSYINSASLGEKKDSCIGVSINGMHYDMGIWKATMLRDMLQAAITGYEITEQALESKD